MRTWDWVTSQLCQTAVECLHCVFTALSKGNLHASPECNILTLNRCGGCTFVIGKSHSEQLKKNKLLFTWKNMYKYGCRSYCYLYHYVICITSVILCNLKQSQTFSFCKLMKIQECFSGHKKSKILNNVYETFTVYNSPKESEVLSSLLRTFFSITHHKERWELKSVKQLLAHATGINLCHQTKQ
jgi:hypothetical protein